MAGNLSEEIEEGLGSLPVMRIAEVFYLLSHQQSPQSTLDKGDATYRNELMQFIKSNKMAPYYKYVCTQLHWPIDSELLTTLEKENKDEAIQLDEKIEDATKNLGDIEILEALLTKARMHCRIGDNEAALKAFAVANEKPQSINQKILVSLHCIRIGLFFNDHKLVEEQIRHATLLIDEGGDWDRRNRLKVYEGCYLMMARDFKKACVLFQESAATFTATELMSYNQLVFYCVVTCILCMNRVELKKKIVDSPEILAVLHHTPYLENFLNGLYDCNYKQFFSALVELYPHILRDKYLSIHSRYIIREYRVLAYSQFLEAYRSVTIESMANAFGISVTFLDAELSRFIAAGRLNAKIDKVNGVIETNRPDSKNAQYQAAIKKGDVVLNRIQKLTRAINV
ncbi:unnamed protein product [Albugo candida]|nr:unnamed protein product [Albugo candida]|eukprot:CCI45949.1 unnamed protein product [Albugo candida]